jgi:T5SS/PEP-CTERM-associated repeat protein/autotransporter-associated beta strand protein
METWNPNAAGGGNGKWDTGITPDWDPGITWTDSNDALFSGTGGVITVITPTANSLTFSATAHYLLQSGTLIMSGSNITVDSAATIASNITSGVGPFVTGTSTLTLTGSGNFGSGTVDVGSGTLAIQSGGSVTGGSGDIGGDAGSNGAVIVSGNGSTWTNSAYLYIGLSGSGTLAVDNGGSVYDIVSAIGENAGSVGAVTVGSGSYWKNSDACVVGEYGTGTLAITSGTVYDEDTTTIGDQAGSSGTLTVSGAGSTLTAYGPVVVGESGTGTLLITGTGAVSNIESIFIGNQGGSSGAVTVSGAHATLTSDGKISVGESGTGTMLITGGASAFDHQGFIGDNAGSSGTVTVSGKGSEWMNDGPLYIGNAGTGSLTITDGASMPPAYYYSTYIGNAEGSNGTLTVSGNGSTWVSGGEFYVGNSGSGTLIISNGGAFRGGGYLGEQIGSTGSATISGTGSTWTSGFLSVGAGGAGSLLITDGGLLAGDGANIFIGTSYGAHGAITVSGSGSSMNDGGSSDLYVGFDGSGTLAITDGATVSSFVATIGYASRAPCMVTVSGTGSQWTTNSEFNYGLIVGAYGDGTLLITDGGVVSSSGGPFPAVLGNFAGSSGSATVSGSGSQWTISSTSNDAGLYVGNSGTGTLLVMNGGNVSDYYGFLGTSAGSTGTVTVSGSGSRWTNSGGVFTGYAAAGNLQITGGGGVSDNNGFIGYGASSSGTATVSGSGSLWTSSSGLFAGYSGTGNLLITGGGDVSDQIGYIAYGASSNGNATVYGSGSVWTTASGLSIGYSGTGNLLITSRGEVSDQIGYIAYGASSSGVVTVSGSGSIFSDSGSLSVGEAGNGTLSVANGGAASSDGGIIGDKAGSTGLVTLSGSGSWSDPAGLTIGQAGAGTLEISGGALVSDLNGLIGSGTGSDGIVSLSGPGSIWTNSASLFVGQSGTGTLVISGGAEVSDSSGYIGNAAGSNGMVTVSGTGSTWANSGGLYIGGNASGPEGTGGLRLTGGGSLSAPRATVWSTGTLDLGENAIFDSPLGVDGGTVSLVDGRLQTVTFAIPVTVDAGSTLGFDIGAGSDQIAFSGGGSLAFIGTSNVDLYNISGLVASGTDVLIAAPTSGDLALGAVYNTGNFAYSLLSTATSEDVIVTATTPLTTAYWKGGQNNIWSILIGGTASNWTVGSAGNSVLHLTPGATTDVIFSAAGAANEGDIVLGTSVTIKSLTISDTNAVVISGSDSNPSFPNNDTLTISGTAGATGIIVNSGAGPVAIGANLYLSGNSQKVTVANSGGLLVSGTLGGSDGLTKAGTGVLTLTGPGSFGSGTVDVEAGTLAIHGTLADGIGEIGNTPGANGAVVVTGSGSAWSAGLVLFVGNSGAGSLLINDGAAALSGATSIGFAAGSRGTVTVSGSGSTWGIQNGGSLTIGEFGAGALTISNGGAVSSPYDSDIGVQAGSSGAVTVSGSGSTWTSGNFNPGPSQFYIADSGSGTLLISNGGVVSDLASTLYVGAQAGSAGVVKVSGIGSVWTGVTDLTIGGNGNTGAGSAGTGTLSVSSGGAVSDGFAVIGNGIGSSGNVTVSGSGSTWTNAGVLSIGYYGIGTLSIIDGGGVSSGTDGGVYAAASLGGVIGAQAGGNGSVTVSGTGSTWTDAGDLEVALGASGLLTITDGGAVSDINGFIDGGNLPSPTSMVTVSGSGSKWTNSGDLYFGETASANMPGRGTLSITAGGAVSTAGEAVIGDAAGTIGTVAVSGSGSAWTNSGNLYVGNSGTGTLLISGGATAISGGSNGAYIGYAAGSNGMVTVSGSGSSWTVANYIYIGAEGIGTILITDGGAVSSAGGIIGGDFGLASGLPAGMVTVTGSGSKWTVSSYIDVGPGSGPFFPYLLRIANGGSVTAPEGVGIDPESVLALGGNATLNGPLSVDSGTVTLVDGQLQTVTLTSRGGDPFTLIADDNLDFDVGHGSDQIVLSGSVSLTVTGTTAVNLYGLSGLVTSGTDVLISANNSADLVVGGNLSLGKVYNSGNFTYSLLSTATSEDVVVSATTPLTAAYWKGGQDNIWSILAGGTASNWTLGSQGNSILHLTPGATTDVVFSATGAANESNTVLGTDMTIKSLTISDTNPVAISGSDPNPWMGTDTLTISGTAGTTGITVNGGAGQVTIGANVYLNGSSRTLTVRNAAGLLISGTLGSSNGLIKSGTGTLTLTGIAAFGGTVADIELGTLAIQNGGSMSNGVAYIGLNGGPGAAVTVSGTSTWTNARNFAVGYYGAGTLSITNGGAVVSESNSYIGYGQGSSGTATLSGNGSEWTTAGSLTIGDLGTGTLSITGGASVDLTGLTAVNGGGTLAFDGASTFNTGSLAINGGTLLTLGAANFNPSAAIGAGGVTINSNGFNSTFSGNLTGAGGLAKSGSGAVTLTGSSTYTGPTAVNAGTLALMTAAAHTASLGSTAITVASGATLSATLSAAPFSKMVNVGAAGSGTAGATLTLTPGSTFSMAGASLATFNLQQETSFTGPAFTIGGASGIAPTLIFDIGNAATGADLLHVTSTVSVLATGGRITVAPLAGDTTLTAGNYDLISSAGGFSGSNGNGLVLSGTALAIDGATYDLSLAHSTTDDEILTLSRSTPSTPASLLAAIPANRTAAPLISTAAIPEPSTTATLLIASALLAASLHRHRT